MSKPSILTKPWSGFSSRLSVRRKVLLPPPLGPTTTTTSPLAIRMVMPLSTCRGPKCLWMFSASSIQRPFPIPALIESLRVMGEQHLLDLCARTVRRRRCAASGGGRVAPRELRLQSFLNEAPDRGHDEVVERRDDEDLQIGR